MFGEVLFTHQLNTKQAKRSILGSNRFIKINITYKTWEMDVNPAPASHMFTCCSLSTLWTQKSVMFRSVFPQKSMFSYWYFSASLRATTIKDTERRSETHQVPRWWWWWWWRCRSHVRIHRQTEKRSCRETLIVHQRSVTDEEVRCPLLL